MKIIIEETRASWETRCTHWDELDELVIRDPFGHTTRYQGRAMVENVYTERPNLLGPSRESFECRVVFKRTDHKVDELPKCATEATDGGSNPDSVGENEAS